LKHMMRRNFCRNMIIRELAIQLVMCLRRRLLHWKMPNIVSDCW
jgi:hypothetical protein